MRAVIARRFGEPEALAVGDWPDPVAGPGQVVVRVHAAPLNYVDLVVIAGRYQFLPSLPFVPGKGPAGVVEAIGPGVDSLVIGDRVLAMAEIGGYAERVAVAANQCYRLPDAISYTAAAAMSLAYDTAWLALRERARLAPGDRVLVLGASGAVGLAAIQLARAMGAATVLAGIARLEKAELVRHAGADGIVDLGAADLRESLRAQVLAQTQGHGVDIVIDPLGGDVFDAALRALAWCGRLVVVGFAAGRIPSVKANYLLVKNIEISGLQISDYRKRRPELLAACFADIFALTVAGRLVPPSVEKLPLERAGEALGRLRDRRVAGRIALVPGG